MTDSNVQVIKEMRTIIEEGNTISPQTRDRLLFTAVIDIYEKLEAFQPALIFYKIGLFFASAIGIAILAFMGGLLTGKIAVTFK
jgi:hypothetical protein